MLIPVLFIIHYQYVCFHYHYFCCPIGWVWDRHISGGGGAPLKDVTGTPITNLRTIVRGSGEKPSRHQYDDELGSPSKRNTYRDTPDDYDYDRRDSRQRDRNRDRDYDRDYDRNRERDNDYRGRNIDRDYDRDNYDDRRAFSRDGNNTANFSASPKKGFGSALKGNYSLNHIDINTYINFRTY